MFRLSLVLLLSLIPVSWTVADTLVGTVTVLGPVNPDGTQVQVDFPVDQRTKNVGGRDGAGLCVFSSIGHAARWQHETRLEDFQTKMRQERGGGYPEKVDKMIRKYGSGTQYLHYEGTDPSILKLALSTGRMPSVTWDGTGDPHYGGQTIAHMVNLVHWSADDKWVVILDNNFVGENELVWMSRKEFLRGWIGQNGSGWAVILLSPPPPPVPHQ